MPNEEDEKPDINLSEVKCRKCVKIKVGMFLSVDEIVDQIRSYLPDGIAYVGKNDFNQVYLVSQTKGSDAYIKVSEPAADPIFNGSTSAVGTDEKAKIPDYSNIYNMVKSNLGYPQIPVELDENQWKLILREALALYNKWRNYDEQLITVNLKGTSETGFEVPPIITDHHDIIDVLFQTRIPFSIYSTGGFEQNMWTMQMLQQYNNTNFMNSGFVADYGIAMMAIQDYTNILGTRPTWTIINDRIFITPHLPMYSRVAIKFRAPLSLDVILRDDFIIKYMSGRARVILGTIRSMYGGTITAGSQTLQMNGGDLISRGDQEMKEAIEDLRKQSLPPELIWG
jgi:hypothetical protein